MKGVVTEWFFHKSYGNELADLLEQDLAQPFSAWIQKTEADMRKHLAKLPKQKGACIAEASGFVIDGLPIFCLQLLSIHSGSTAPEQCAIYVGPKEYILLKRTEIIEQFEDHLAKHDGVMVEQNL